MKFVCVFIIATSIFSQAINAENLESKKLCPCEETSFLSSCLSSLGKTFIRVAAGSGIGAMLALKSTLAKISVPLKSSKIFIDHSSYLNEKYMGIIKTGFGAVIGLLSFSIF